MLKFVPKKKKFASAFVEEKQEDEDFSNLLYQTEIYFGKPLTQSDVQALLYIFEELKFSPDLLEYLVEHCVSIGKKSCRYIEAVAIEWYKKNLEIKLDPNEGACFTKIFSFRKESCLADVEEKIRLKIGEILGTDNSDAIKFCLNSLRL